jgi:hypothetical protein
VDDEGNVLIKSQAYTEYFVRGSEPVDYCPIHGGYGMTPGAFASFEAPPPPHDARPGGEPAHAPVVTGGTVSSAPPSPQAPPPPQPPKKRGFWGRVFGR